METSRQQSVASVAHQALVEIAPNSQELRLFQATQEEYFRNPQRALEGVKVDDRPVGSGLGVGEIILTPVLLWIGGKLLDLAWDLVKKPLEEELSDPVSRFIRKILRRFGLAKAQKPPSFPALTLAQKEQLRQKTLADGDLQQLIQHYGLGSDLTTQLVEVMITQLPSAAESSSPRESTP